MTRDRISDTDRKRDGDQTWFFMITDRRSGEIIGAIALKGFTREHYRAKIGSWIGRPIWNRGYATGAVCSVLDYGFWGWVSIGSMPSLSPATKPQGA